MASARTRWKFPGGVGPPLRGPFPGASRPGRDRSRRRPRTGRRPAGPASATRGRGPPPGRFRPAPMSAAATIRRMVLPSMTKFWPRVLVGRTPISSASRRMSEAPIQRALARYRAGRRESVQSPRYPIPAGGTGPQRPGTAGIRTTAARQRPGPEVPDPALSRLRSCGQPPRRRCLQCWPASWRRPSRSPRAGGRAVRRPGWRCRSAAPWWPGWRWGRKRRRRSRARSGCRTAGRRSSRCRC